jgi:hypothetical protein
MARATRKNITKPVVISNDDDPVVRIACEIDHLWDAENGLESEGLDQRKENGGRIPAMIRSQCRNIVKWREALELAGTFTVASTLQGALIQLAWALNDAETLAGNAEANARAGEQQYDLSDHIDRVRRLVRSAADVVMTTLGDDYREIQRLVETYHSIGDERPNWLKSINDWADKAWLERERESAAAEKAKAEVAA